MPLTSSRVHNVSSRKRATPRLVAMSAFQFAKGHGTGNDFVLLPDPDGELELTAELVRRICDRRFGVGGDGVLRVVRTERASTAPNVDVAAYPNAPTWFMDYRNADGTTAEMCGNGIRVFARYLRQQGWLPAGRSEIATRGGVKVVEVPDVGDIAVDMGPASSDGYPGEVSLSLDGRDYVGQPWRMSNPNAVVFLDSLTMLPATLGTPELPADVFPAGANVEFVEITGARSARMRVVERGVGETLSCGTGACAVAGAMAAKLGIPAGEEMTIAVPGGELRISLTAAGSVLMSGPAEIVAHGQFDEHWWGL